MLQTASHPTCASAGPFLPSGRGAGGVPGSLPEGYNGRPTRDIVNTMLREHAVIPPPRDFPLCFRGSTSCYREASRTQIGLRLLLYTSCVEIQRLLIQDKTNNTTVAAWMPVYMNRSKSLSILASFHRFSVTRRISGNQSRISSS